jgi:hypothetical protein
MDVKLLVVAIIHLVLEHLLAVAHCGCRSLV